MAFRLPSLPALRVFEAAARHLSFTKAAQELNVTQAAVSHQVRALEEQLGLALFRRTTRRLALTREGQRLQPAATEAFEILRRALTDIGRGEQVLSITTTPSFGARWLAPRLGRFAERHPEWMRPRWPNRVKVWRELLLAAASGEVVALENARMHGLQLLAAECRAASMLRP